MRAACWDVHALLRALPVAGARVWAEGLLGFLGTLIWASDKGPVLRVLDVDPDSRVPERWTTLAPFNDPGGAGR